MLHSIVARSVRWRSGRSRGAAGQQRQPLLEPLEDLREVRGLDPSRRELERQR